MKKLQFLHQKLLMTLMLVLSVFVQLNAEEVTNNDDNIYHSDTIGTQTKTVENFKTTEDRNVQSILNATVSTVTSTTGKVWMDRNLGASRVATSSTDSESYGDLYQWGRGSDGHEKRTSETTSTLSSSDTPGHGMFIITSSETYDWRSPQNDNLWQGVNGNNNPCPEGFRIPSVAEWSAELDKWSSRDSYGAFQSPLKLPAGGTRISSDGSLYSVGWEGHYWSATVNGTNVKSLYTYIDIAFVENYFRAQGLSVRCIKEQSLPTVTTTSISEITTSSAMSGGSISSDEGESITARGVCWSTSENPTVSLSTKTTDGAGVGTFSSSLLELQSFTTYFVRAYATNSIGTAYGNQISFTTTVSTVTSTTGKVWMDKNLGASRVATSSTDSEAYGDLYQWGRGTDGHEKRNSETTSTLSSSDTPGHGMFILSQFSSYDWRSPSNDNLWQGVNGTNNPCPEGFRIPTFAEWNAELGSWSTKNSSGAFTSPLKLPAAGLRYNTDGSLNNVGTSGSYWSNTLYLSSAATLRFYSTKAMRVNENYRSGGGSVRCIKQNPPTLSTISLSEITNISAMSGGSISSDEGEVITARGVCWSKSPNPTIADSKTIDGTGVGTFNSQITGLIPNTSYYLRAYATNAIGTAYGEELRFKTYTSQITDIDGNVYYTVKIGNQEWMAENLKTTKYRNGDVITQQWAYDNDENNVAKYGRLYTWYAATDGRQIAPAGWHVPNDTEWTTLQNYLIANGYNYDGTTADNKIAKSMAATTDWTTYTGTGAVGDNLLSNNSSGFSALPGGNRSSNGIFSSIGTAGYWLTSSNYSIYPADIDYFRGRMLQNNYTLLGQTASLKSFGVSVRCVKDTEVTWVGTTNSDWATATNWIPNIVPEYGVNVTIENVINYPIISSNASVNNLTIKPNAKLTLNSTFKLNVAGNLVIQSDASGTGTFVDNGTTIISGNSTVNQAVTGKRSYYMGTPVGATPTLTGVTGISKFDIVSDTWSTPVLTPSLISTPGVGYLIQVGETGTTNISFTGILNNGQKYLEFAITGKRFIFLGNPYPSYLDGKKVVDATTSVEKSIWYRGKDTDGVYKFYTYNVPADLSIPAASIPAEATNNGFIPPMQGFWLRAKTGNSSLGYFFSNSMRTHNTTGINIPLKAPHKAGSQILRIQVSNGNLTDEAVVLFNENAQFTFDSYDASKMMNTGSLALNIYTVQGTENLVLNSQPAIVYEEEIPVGVKLNAGIYTVSVKEFSNFDEGEKVQLLDKSTGFITNLTATDYTFNLNDALNSSTRFALIFPKKVITDIADSGTEYVYVYTANNRIHVNASETYEGNMIHVYNGVGQLLAVESVNKGTNEIGRTFLEGVYFVKVNNRTTKVVIK